MNYYRACHYNKLLKVHIQKGQVHYFPLPSLGRADSNLLKFFFLFQLRMFFFFKRLCDHFFLHNAAPVFFFSSPSSSEVQRKWSRENRAAGLRSVSLFSPSGSNSSLPPACLRTSHLFFYCFFLFFCCCTGTNPLILQVISGFFFFCNNNNNTTQTPQKLP